MLNKWDRMCRETEERGERGEWSVWPKPRRAGMAVERGQGRRQGLTHLA